MAKRVVHVPESDANDLCTMLSLAAAAEATGVSLVPVDDAHFYASESSSRDYQHWLLEAGQALAA